MVERQTQYTDHDGKVTVDHPNAPVFEVYDPHPLFDIPLEETFEAFLEACITSGVPQSFEGEFDGTDILVFKFEKTIQEILPWIGEDVHNSCSQIAVENTHQIGPNNCDDWETVATAWVSQYINCYNLILEQTEPDPLDSLIASINDYNKQNQSNPEILLSYIASQLDLQSPPE